MRRPEEDPLPCTLGSVQSLTLRINSEDASASAFSATVLSDFLAPSNQLARYTTSEAAVLIKQVADLYPTEPRRLDHAIWRYVSGRDVFREEEMTADLRADD